jgi:hypothetical protein
MNYTSKLIAWSLHLPYSQVYTFITYINVPHAVVILSTFIASCIFSFSIFTYCVALAQKFTSVLVLLCNLVICTTMMNTQIPVIYQTLHDVLTCTCVALIFGSAMEHKRSQPIITRKAEHGQHYILPHSLYYYCYF